MFITSVIKSSRSNSYRPILPMRHKEKCSRPHGLLHRQPKRNKWSALYNQMYPAELPRSKPNQAHKSIDLAIKVPSSQQSARWRLLASSTLSDTSFASHISPTLWSGVAQRVSLVPARPCCVWTLDLGRVGSPLTLCLTALNRLRFLVSWAFVGFCKSCIWECNFHLLLCKFGCVRRTYDHYKLYFWQLKITFSCKK